jgi:hypothetical protein
MKGNTPRSSYTLLTNDCTNEKPHVLIHAMLKRRALDSIHGNPLVRESNAISKCNATSNLVMPISNSFYF